MNSTAIPLRLSANGAYNCRKAKVAPLVLAQAIVVYIARASRDLICNTSSIITKLVIIIVLNYTKVSNTFIRQSLLI